MRPTKTLGEIVKITKGKKVDFSDKGEKGYIDIGILRTNKIEQYTDDNGVECNENDILIAWDGSKSGTIGYGLNGIIGSTLAKLEITEKDIYTPYVGEFLKSKFDYLNTYTSGAAIPHIRKEVLVGIEIPLPPLETQKAIVAKLDQIFAEFDQTKSEIQKNLDNTDELWKSALNQAFQGDWEMKKLDNIVDFSQGIQVPIEDQSMVEKPGLVRFLRIIDFTQGGQEPRYVENFGDRYYVNNDDLSMVRYGATTGFICSGMEGIIANNLFKITPKKENILKKYLYVYFKSPYFDRFLQKEVFGAAMPAISFGTLKNVEIPVPPLSEQEKIVEHLDQVSKEVKALKFQYQSQLDNLEELKKSVLDKAFKGELGE